MNQRIRKMLSVLAACFFAHGSLGLAARPETSSDASFDPDAMPKLAVIISEEGQGSGRSMGFGALGGFGMGAGRDAQSNLQRSIEDEFVQVLMRKGYKVVSRSDVQSVVKEQGFQRSGLTERDAAALGKILNVPAVMVVRVTEFSTAVKSGPKARVTEATAGVGARLISVESANILWIGKYSQTHVVNSQGDASQVVAGVAKAIASAFPARKTSKKSEGTK